MADDKLNWFFCLNENRNGAFIDMAKVAVLSSMNFKLNRYCVYDGDNMDFVAFLKKYGVTVIFHETTFKEKITQFVNRVARPTFYGAFLRVDIPLIIKKLNLRVPYYLYTDCDVIFNKDPSQYLFELSPEYLAATGEFVRHDDSMFNSGVMWCNAEKMYATHEAFYNFVISEKFEFKATDQGALNEFYPYDRICDEMNWKPYWGINENTYLVHFHGPKPYHFKIYVNEDEKLTNPHVKNYGSFLNSVNFENYNHYVAMYDKYLLEANLNR